MNRHFLIAVDGSAYSRRALRYVAGIYKDVADVSVTLITVSKPIPSYLTEGAESYQVERTRLKRLEALVARQAEECSRILDDARDVLVREGMDPGNIQRKSVSQGMGPVKDVLLEAKSGLYDALVVGRRGLGRLAAYFMGSVTYGLLQQVVDVPLWIVDSPKESKKFLVALDVCRPCLKVLDHAAFVLSGVRDIHITVLHVIPRFRPFLGKEESASFDEVERLIEKHEEARLKELLGNIKEIFSEAGIGKEDIQIKIKKGGGGVAHEILKEYEGGGYGTLIMGRRGIGGWEALFPGSVSNKVLGTLGGGAVWIVT